VQVENATKSSLATHFAVAAALMKVNATESRRLGADASPRRLPGTWSIAFEFTVSAEKAAAVETKTAALTANPTAAKAALAPLLIAGLKAAGVVASVAEAMTVTGVAATATKVIAPSDRTTTTPMSGPATSGAYKAALSMVMMVIAAFKMMF